MNGAGHWPTNRASLSRPTTFSTSEPTIDTPASHRNRSDGSLAVWVSMARATLPSRCSGGVTVRMADSFGFRFRCSFGDSPGLNASLPRPASHVPMPGAKPVPRSKRPDPMRLLDRHPVVRTRLRFLRQAIDSVRSQAGPFDLRHVVVDGGSTDGSTDLLRSIIDPRLSWTSGPDAGQSDAVNKGLTTVDLAGPADGDTDVVGWLNSDDLYLPGALAAVAAAFADPAARWAVGRYRVIDEAGRTLPAGHRPVQGAAAAAVHLRPAAPPELHPPTGRVLAGVVRPGDRPAGRVAPLHDGLRPLATDGRHGRPGR